jgi:dTMP kinase
MILRNFAVFEGIDGTGTTTQIAELRKRYEGKLDTGNPPVFFTCEPTDGEIGRMIRRALRGEVAFHADTMARLFATDRCEHLYGESGIVSQLGQGRAAISDRYLFSSLAYQGETGDPELPWELNKSFPLPEFLFFFDIDSDVSMDRVERRAEGLEIYEKREFQKKVRSRYHEIILGFERSEPEMTVIRIDATESVGAIAEKIWSVAKNLPKI